MAYRKNKYGAKKVVVGKEKFDSKLEYYRWVFLLEQQRLSKIYGLVRQVPFELIPAQYEIEVKQLKTKTKEVSRVAEEPVVYIADFTYYKTDSHSRVIEDTKSEATRKNPAYIIKRKLMRWQGHPIKEVTRATEEV